MDNVVSAGFTSTGTATMAIAAFALAAGLVVFGLKAGIRTGKSVWAMITGS